MKNFINIRDISTKDLRKIIFDAKKRKKKKNKINKKKKNIKKINKNK